MSSRWIELYATSPSGKTMFVCRMCGDKTPTPTARCPSPPEVTGKMQLDCQLLEEIQGALADETVDTNSAGGLDSVRVLLVGDKTDATPNGNRTSVIWSSRTERWRSTEIYFEREEDKKK